MINLIESGNIVIFEDIDTQSVVSKRKDEDEDEKCNKFKLSITMDVLLNVLDGYNYLHDTIIIMTTNHIEKIDPAVIRPGRIDQKIKFDNADTDQINNIFNYFYKKPLKLSNTINKSTSEIINSIVLPNINDYDKAKKLII